MTDREAIVEDLCQFVRTRSLTGRPVTSETDLLGTGLLDSMLVIDLVAHVEARHGVSIGDGEITPEHFRSIAPLADLISRKRNNVQRGVPRSAAEGE